MKKKKEKKRGEKYDAKWNINLSTSGQTVSWKQVRVIACADSANWQSFGQMSWKETQWFVIPACEKCHVRKQMVLTLMVKDSAAQIFQKFGSTLARNLKRSNFYLPYLPHLLLLLRQIQRHWCPLEYSNQCIESSRKVRRNMFASQDKTDLSSHLKWMRSIYIMRASVRKIVGYYILFWSPAILPHMDQISEYLECFVSRVSVQYHILKKSSNCSNHVKAIKFNVLKIGILWCLLPLLEILAG